MATDSNNQGGYCYYIDLTARTTYSPERLLQRLRRGGIPMQPLADDKGEGVVCVFFDSATALEDFWVQTGEQHAGVARLIGIMMKPQLLSSHRVLVWIRSGFADVLAYQEEESFALVLQEKLKRWLFVEGLLQIAYIRNNLIGHSSCWLNTLREVIEIAHFSDLNVLVLGESGTGKELISRLVHELDPRKGKGQFVVVDCTTISPELAGSELFGHEKGAFTSAIASREGAFALAHNGTLFLDEIGELPNGLQSELLRVVQEGVYKKVGSNHWKQTNFRLVCATNRKLDNGEDILFRQDLFYRIAGWTCRLPTLEQRREDIPALARHFFSKKIRMSSPLDIDPLLLAYLAERDYPGNIRELQQLVNRIAAAYTGQGPITLGCLPRAEWQRPLASHLTIVHHREAESGVGDIEQYVRQALSEGWTLKDIKNAAAQAAISEAIRMEAGNLQQAARLLGVTDRTLQLWRASNREVI